MEKRDIICLSFEFWNKMWRMTQQKMYYISNLTGCKILYINPTIDFLYLLFNFRSCLKLYGLTTIARALFGLHLKYNENIIIFTPSRMIPFSYRFKFLYKLEYNIYRRRIRKLVTKYNFREAILWINRPFDSKNENMGFPFDFTVFDWTDDWYSFEKYEKNEITIKTREEEIYNSLLSDSKIVFCVSKNLYQRAKKINKNSYLIPNATDYKNFSQCRNNNLNRIRNIERLGVYKIGYVGFILNRIDFKLIDFASKQNSDLEFIFVGPIMKSFKIPKYIQNNQHVHFIGPVDYYDLPCYIQYFDVLIIPHYVDEVTSSMDPIKIYDYLATGKPIVTSRVAGSDKFHNIINISKNKEEFYKMIMDSLINEEEKNINLRMEAGKNNSWENRAKKIVDILNQYMK